MEAKAVPVAGERALLVSSRSGRTLVVADLHIGIEHELKKEGILIPSATPIMLQRLKSLIKQTTSSSLVILGDLKQSFAWTPYAEEQTVLDLIEPLSKLVTIEIVPGNHDGNLDRILPKAKIYHSSGFIKDKIAYFHGHAWPNEALLEAKTLVLAHVHPNIAIRGRMGSRNKEPCWIRAPILEKALLEHYPKAKLPENQSAIVMPAFNPLLGGMPVNKSLRTVPKGYRLAFNKCIDFRNGEVFLIDGTNLGKLKGIR